MKLLGAHNTLTAYSSIFDRKKFLRCQSKKVGDLYRCGVKVFDIRIHMFKGKIYASHGGANYKVNVSEIIRYINNLPDPIYIRLINEDTIQNSDYLEFLKQAKEWIKLYHHVKWQIIDSKKVWSIYYNEFPHETQYNLYWKMGMKPNKPKPYADKYNNENFEKYRDSTSGIWWFDFI